MIMSQNIIPSFLKKGDLIGITCPSGHMNPKNAEICVKQLREKGYEVMLGKTITYPSDNYFSAPDDVKLDELQAMLDAPEIKAILFGRGGYGMSRLMDQLDFKHFRKNPKWLIGFSDITIMLNHVYSNFRMASIHGPMCGAFRNKKQAENVTSLFQVLSGKKIKLSAESHPQNRIGVAKGTLVGGNLCLLANSIGTASSMKTAGKILLIEEIGEYLYSIDRLLQQLKRSGQLSRLSGLVIGSFTDIKDTERPFGKTYEEIIADIVKPYSFPVAFGFPIGHGDQNKAVKIGVEYELKVGSKKSVLNEIN